LLFLRGQSNRHRQRNKYGHRSKARQCSGFHGRLPYVTFSVPLLLIGGNSGKKLPGRYDCEARRDDQVYEE
jgi:hypothetical protein